MKTESYQNDTRFPNFLVVGAAKSGTSSLHSYLSQHPEIFLPQGYKELWFWHQNRNENKAIYNYWDKSRIPQSIDEYLSYFKDAQQDQLTGEVCPSYLYYHKHTINSLKELHPNWSEVKIIIILRNPTDRILSDYRFVRQNHFDPENYNLETALLKETERIDDPQLLPGLHYRALSSYCQQVEAYLNNFPNVHICLFDDLLSNAGKLLQGIYSFLEVDPQFQTNTKKVFNVSKPVQTQRHGLSNLLYQTLQTFGSRLPDSVRKPAAKFASQVLYQEEPIPHKLIKSLRLEFINEIEQLEKMTNKDLSAWKVVK